MHISTSHHFIVLANPKCGSQSIRRMVRAYCDIRGKRKAVREADHPMPIGNHAPARVVKEKLEEKGYDWSEFTTITTTRNPWDRIVSAWHFAAKEPESVWYRRRQAADNDFRAFVRLVPEHLAIDTFAGDGNGTLIVDHIVPIEAAGEGLQPIFESLGLPWRRLLHTNKSREDTSYRDYFDEESRDRIAAIFARDIEIGGYSF